MNVWLQAVFLVASSKKGINANQLHRSLGITLKSAWIMSHRIHEAQLMTDESAIYKSFGPSFAGHNIVRHARRIRQQRESIDAYQHHRRPLLTLQARHEEDLPTLRT